MKVSWQTELGVCIIIYAVFRLFWSLVFSVGGGSAEGWLLSPVAFSNRNRIFDGRSDNVFRGYRNGVYFTLGVLVISGLFSIAFPWRRNQTQFPSPGVRQ